MENAVKHKTKALLIFVLFAASIVGHPSQATPPAPGRPSLLAIFFTADWCGRCKILKPKLAQVQRDFAGQSILFTQFDLTDDYTREQSGRFAALLGLEELYREYEGKESGRTGFILLVEAGSRKSVGQITSELTPAEIRARIGDALKHTAARKSGFADVNGTRLYYEVAGQGTPAVLIHGGFMDSRMWDAQFEELARQFMVIRYDVRGAGQSARNYKEPYSSVQDLDALLQFLGVSRAHIVGLSDGGELAINFVLEKPERASSLIAAEAGLTGLPFQGDGMDFMKRVFAIADSQGAEAAAMVFADAPVFASMKKTNPSAMEHLKRLLRDNAHLLVEGRKDQRPKPPAAERLHEIKVPTLVMVSQHEGGYAAQVAARLMSGIRGASRHMIANSGHMMNMEQPAEFNRVVIEFLRSTASR